MGASPCSGRHLLLAMWAVGPLPGGLASQHAQGSGAESAGTAGIRCRGASTRAGGNERGGTAK
eukprot:7340428-Alexandrium_andersonii.AAC.1